MASVVSQLVEEVTANAQSDSLEDAREICADGTYFPNNLRTFTTNKSRWSVCAQTCRKLSAAPTHSSQAYGETDQQHYLCRA